MKTFKKIFIFALFLSLFISCTDFEETEDLDNTNQTELATGDEGEEVDETEKDSNHTNQAKSDTGDEGEEVDETEKG